MEKIKLSEQKIESIKNDEKILSEGLIQTMRLYSNNNSLHTFKYVLTDKGIWIKSKKILFIKSKEAFIAYKDIKEYAIRVYVKKPYFIFYPNNGKKPANRVFFKDTESIKTILDEYLSEIKK